MAEQTIGAADGTAGHAGPRPAGCDGGGGRVAVDVGLPGGAVRRRSAAGGAGRGRGAAARRHIGRPEVLRRLGLRRGAAGARDHPGRDGAASRRDRPRRGRSRSFRRARSCGTRPATTATSTTKPTPSRARPRRRSPQPKARAPNASFSNQTKPSEQGAAFVIPVEKTQKIKFKKVA